MLKAFAWKGCKGFDQNWFWIGLCLMVVNWYFQSAYCEGRLVIPDEFVTYTVVQDAFCDDHEAREAVSRSRDTLAEFLHALAHREPGQTEFLVTVMRRKDATLVPVGILAEKTADGRIQGREVPNGLVLSPAHRVVCSEEHAVDWRYVDSFELVGGRLYRSLLNKQPLPVRRSIEDKQLFLLDWYEPMDAAFRDLCRDVANLRYDRVERALRKHPELACREALAVVPGPAAARYRLLSHTIASYAAKFGDSRMMRLLHDHGAFPEAEARGSLLEDAAGGGKIDTARALLELGVDVEGGTAGEWWPLWYAVRWDREPMVAFLLKKGADPNRRNHAGRTPLFTCGSADIARRLLAAGARADARDHEGVTALKHHAMHGRTDLVELLKKSGGKPDRALVIGASEEEIRRRGLEVLRSHYREHDPAHLEEIELMHAVDYGCVLPVRSLPLPDTKGN